MYCSGCEDTGHGHVPFNIDLAPESMAPGSPLGSILPGHQVQASELDEGNNIIVPWLDKASGPVIVYLDCPSALEMLNVHDIRHAPTYLSWEGDMACFFRSGLKSLELRPKIRVIPARHRIAPHGPQQHLERGPRLYRDEPHHWSHGWPESSWQTIPTCIENDNKDSTTQSPCISRPDPDVNGRVVAEREKKGSPVGEGGAHMELENRTKTSKRSRKMFAFLMETRFELARFPTADVEVSSKHPSRGTQGFLNTAP